MFACTTDPWPAPTRPSKANHRHAPLHRRLPAEEPWAAPCCCPPFSLPFPPWMPLSRGQPMRVQPPPVPAGHRTNTKHSRTARHCRTDKYGCTDGHGRTDRHGRTDKYGCTDGHGRIGRHIWPPSTFLCPKAHSGTQPDAKNRLGGPGFHNPPIGTTHTRKRMQGG